MPRRIGARPDNDEIVVHHVAAIDAVAVGDELVLADAIVDQQRIGIAARADRQRLAGADRDHMNADRPVADRKIGRMWPNNPESWVEVVELSVMKRSSACAAVTRKMDRSRPAIRVMNGASADGASYPGHEQQ